MKRFTLSKLIVIVAFLLGAGVSVKAQTTVFNFNGTTGLGGAGISGSPQTYVVPSGVTSLAIDMYGGKGGWPCCSWTSSGGPIARGGRVQCTLTVTPGDILYVYVGGAGADNLNSGTQCPGGWNGGGVGGAVGSAFCAGGGGESDIRTSTSGSYASTVLVVAGAGGGGGDFSPVGGAGGGLTGGTGQTGSLTTIGGACGGGQTGPSCTTGSGNGGQGVGGTCTCYSEGGGGAGWWGGNGGTASNGGAGGGSSYTNPIRCSNVIHTQGYSLATGNGQVSITPLCGAGIITGAPGVCLGATTALTDVTTGAGWGWFSSNTAVATVTSSGVVTGVTIGTALISYGGFLACGTVYATKLITVTPIPTAITGAPICQSFTSTFSSSSSVGTWTSSNTALATIASSGVATGVAPGTLTITYSISSACYTTTQTTVNPTAPVTGPTAVCPGLIINLSDAVSGGTWTSSDTHLATVDPSTGVVTGVAAGNPTISYTLSTGCVTTYPITVYSLPAAFSGAGAVCKGLAITLTETTTGGTWTSSATAVAIVGAATTTTGTVTGLNAGTAVITYTTPNTCIMTKTITVNPLPATITGPAVICMTDAINPPATLSDATLGGTWTSGNPTATIVPGTGVVSGIAPGTAVITYTLPTGCITTDQIYINASPGPIMGNKVVCANDVTYLTNTSLGGLWSSSNSGMATVSSGTGIVTGAGTYSTQQTPTITYTLATGCLTITTVSVNPAPRPITGSTSVCAGSSATLSSPVAGTWVSINPGYATITSGPAATASLEGVQAGNTNIKFTLPATGCSLLIPVTVNPTPAAITPAFPIICLGNTLTLNDIDGSGSWSTSSAAVTVDAGGVVTPVASATTATIDYSFTTGCKTSVVVSVNPSPAVYNLASFTGQSDYCAGGTGIDLYMNVTTPGIRYQLYNNGIAIPGYMTGTGTGLHFGNQTAGGTYTAVATDPATGCISNMTGSPSITVNPLPDQYTVKYTGSTNAYCDGAASGIDVLLDNSQATVNYTLYKNSTAGTPVSGTGLALDFGLLPEGVYTVTGEDATTHCTSNMAGSVAVVKNTLPDIHNVLVSDSGYYCAGGSGVHIQLDLGNAGITYELHNGSPLAVGTVSGANSAVDFGPHTAGSYTVLATNALTGCQQNMNGTIVVTARPLPSLHNITGGGKYCTGSAGAPVGLDNSNNGISYQLYNGTTATGSPVAGTSPSSAISFGTVSVPGTYTVRATDMLTNCSVNMTGSTAVSASAALAIYTVTTEGTGSYCANGSGLHVYLSGSSPFVKYDLVNRGAVVATQPSGTGGMLDFGLMTADSVYTVIATDSGAAGCTAAMAGSPAITINALPQAINVTVDNGGNYCAGGSGVSIGLAFSDAGVTYELYKNSVATGIQLAGANSSINFGKYTSEATYTVEATNNTTQCANNMTGSAIVKAMPAPVPYTLTGGGSYCTGGSGVAVGVFRSDAGVNYQLFYGGSPFGSAVPGTGSAIGFGIQTADGIYTVVGMDGTTGCTGNMTGSTVITIDPLPVAYDVTGGGSYCAGGAGLPIGLSNSVTGVNYQLLNSGVPVGAAMAGTTGSAINFGVKTVAGNYTVVANTAISGCTNSMTGSKVITVNALPAIDTVKGGGGYCAGDAGADIYMAHTRPGVNYMLYHGGAPVGIAVLGDGTNADLGLQRTTGNYTVIAADAATGCTSNMAGTVTVNINPLPFAYTITGGGTLCAGSTGYHIMLGGSQTGVRYNLYRSGVSTPVLLSGTDMALDFGGQTTGGIYTVTAVNGTTGCANNMTGSGTVTVNPAPASFAVMNGGHYCAGGAGVSVDLSGSETGINYQLYNGGAATGMPVGGTGTLISFGLQKAEGAEYTVRAVNTTSACGSDMTGSVAVVKDIPGTPTVSVVLSKPTACVGDAITYTAMAVNGGSAPAYVWKVNSIIAGIGDSYSNIPAEGDIVSVTMTSNANCITTARADNSVTMSLVPYVTPAATVAVTPGTSVCHGTTVSLKATTVYGGDGPGYFWMRNGVFVDSGTSYTYTPNSGNDQDVITFMLRSNYACSTNDTVFSDPVVMTVDSAVVPVFALTSSFGPQVDAQGVVGQIDTFTAVIDTKYINWHYTYQWYVQGTPVPGATEPVYIDHTTYNNDVVSCEVTKTGACGSQPATKQIVAMLKNLGTQVVTAGGEVSVLPNPNKGDFTVKGTVGTGKDEAVTLEVTNMLGQRVYNSKVMARGGAINEHIKLGNALASGMYLLTLRSETATNVFHMVIEQ